MKLPRLRLLGSPQHVNGCPSRQAELVAACEAAIRRQCAVLWRLLSYPNKRGDVPLSPVTSSDTVGMLLFAQRERFDPDAPTVVWDLAFQAQLTGVGGARYKPGKPMHHVMDVELAEVGLPSGWFWVWISAWVGATWWLCQLS